MRTVRTAMRMLDNVIDINYYAVDKARNSNLRHRPVGMGIMGCAVPLNADLPILLDRKRELLKLSLVDAAFSIGLLIAATPFGIQWIAASRLLHGLVWVAIYLPFTCRLAGLDRKALWRVYRASLIATLAAITPALALYALWQDQHAAGWGQALVAALLGALLWLASLFAMRHPICADIAGIVEDIRKSLLPRLSR